MPSPLNIPIPKYQDQINIPIPGKPGEFDHHQFMKNTTSFLILTKVGNDAKRVQRTPCTKMRTVFSSIRLDLKTSVCSEVCHCCVHCTKLWCDHLWNNITRVQQARLLASRGCQIREAPLVALRTFTKIYAYSHVSIVRLVQSIILVSRDFQNHSSPLHHLPSELVSLTSIPTPSIDFNLWKLSRPSTFVPMSLGFTSVSTDDIDKSFRNTKSWMKSNLVWMCFIVGLAPCFVATPRAVLLSVLACVRNDSPISFSMTCAKVNSTDSAPRAYIPDSPLDNATVHCPRHSLREEKLINVTQSAKCAFPRHWVTGPMAQSASEYPVTCFKSCSSRSVSMQTSTNRNLTLVFLSNNLTFLARVKHATVGVEILWEKKKRRKRRYSPCSRSCASFAWRSNCQAQCTARSAWEGRRGRGWWRTDRSREWERWTQRETHMYMDDMMGLRTWAKKCMWPNIKECDKVALALRVFMFMFMSLYLLLMWSHACPQCPCRSSCCICIVSVTNYL